MYRLVIVDDEILVRLGLRSMIDWEREGFEIVGEAEDGRSGLELIATEHPSLVITDIKMPVMDGLEMIRQCREKGETSAFLVLSGYGDLALVKKVMRLGAVDYLLKVELNADSLRSALNAAREELSHQKGQESSARETAFQPETMLRKLLLAVQEPSHQALQELSYRMQQISLSACYVIDVNLEGVDFLSAGEHQQPFYYLDICKSILERMGKGYAFSAGNHQLALVVFEGENRQRALDVFSLCVTISGAFEQYLRRNATFGISQKQRDPTTLREAYRQAFLADQATFYQLDAIKIYDASLENLRYINILPEVVTLLPLLQKAIHEENQEEVLHQLETCERILQTRLPERESAYEACHQITQTLLMSGEKGRQILGESFAEEYTGVSMIRRMRNIREMQSWLRELVDAARYLYESAEEDFTAGKIRRAKEYIRENICQKIQLADVAEELMISKSYLSTMFKKAEGISFVDYISNEKIAKARELLRSGEYRVYEISDMLGYEDIYYFSKVFKKVTGMTPTEYAKRA